MSMAYSPHETRATNIPVNVMSGLHRKTISVDQTIPLPVGGYFRPIGVLNLEEITESVIEISNAGTTGFVILDALQLLPIKKRTNE